MPTPRDIDSSTRLLITGATGFVGGHLATTLVRQNVPLRLLVRPTSDLGRLSRPVQHAIKAGDGAVNLVEADLTDPTSLDDICASVDGLIHCACAVKTTFDESQRSRQIFNQVNVDGTRNLARRAVEAGIRMVHMSSTAAMGPVRATEVDEHTPCIPKAPYQVSKRRAELTLLDLHDRHGLDVSILRPCLIVGPGKDGGELLDLFKLVRWGVFPKIGGRMTQTKPLIDVRDVVEACRIAFTRAPSGHIYLIHSDGQHTLGEILEVTRRLVGSRRSGVPIPTAPVRAAAHAFKSAAAMAPWFNPPITPARLDLFLADRHISVTEARRQWGFDPHHQDLYEMLGPAYVEYLRDGQL